MLHNEYCMGLPNPGSHQAFRHGCVCHMLLNQFGLGSDMSGVSRHWIVNPSCSMHTTITRKVQDAIQRGARIFEESEIGYEY
jgi:hypothetical protein